MSRDGLVYDSFLIGTDLESPERIKQIKSYLEKFPEEFPFTTNTKDYGLAPILVIHDREYVEYLQNIFQEWFEFLSN